jgi:hypothetical protein
MTEEVIATVEETVKDPYIALATKYGWNPEKGDKSPQAFIEYAMENLEPRGKELKEVKQTLAALSTHMEEQKKQAYQQALKDIEARKEAAIRAGDAKAIDQIYEEKHKLANPIQVMNPLNAFDMKYHEMINDMSLDAFDIRKFVENRFIDLKDKNLSPDEHVAIVEKDMLKKFPDYFGIIKSKPALEKDQNRNSSDGTTTQDLSYGDLTKEQKEVAQFLKTRGIAIEKYITSLKGAK